jgi:hypothetical protein
MDGANIEIAEEIDPENMFIFGARAHEVCARVLLFDLSCAINQHGRRPASRARSTHTPTPHTHTTQPVPLCNCHCVAVWCAQSGWAPTTHHPSPLPLCTRSPTRLCGVRCVWCVSGAPRQVAALRASLSGPPPTPSPEWAGVIGSIASGEFGSDEDVTGILHSLEWKNDYYLLQADFASCMWASAQAQAQPLTNTHMQRLSYPLPVRVSNALHHPAPCVPNQCRVRTSLCNYPPAPCADLEAQQAVDAAFKDRRLWLQKSIMSTAGMGKFSTDRT